MSEKREPERLTVDDLEKMTTHDLADLLANVVLVLKRLPDVPVKELKRETGGEMGGVRGRTIGEQRMPEEYGW